jgi:oligopeptide/dipeptide ABC transporter ATP-binding protein
VRTGQAGNHGAGELLLAVDSLVVHYAGRRGQRPIRAVDGVTFAVEAGETLGIIGESGCGKSTVARAVLGLVPVNGGSIRIGGVEAWPTGKREQRRLRRLVQVVFQDAHEALDPRMSVLASVEEPLRMARELDAPARRAKAVELLEQVGLGPVYGDRRPHELSGGQKQRVTIARALALDPQLIVCDEVVSALDVSVQAEILNLFADLQAQRSFSYLFISHDLSVVAHLAHRIGVMYLGLLVEVGPVDVVADAPAHPYTRALVEAQPQAAPGRERGQARQIIEGDMPSPVDPPSGCRFRTRCPHRRPRCAEEVPALRPVGPGHIVACHFAEEVMDRDSSDVSVPVAVSFARRHDGRSDSTLGGHQ